MIVHRSKKTTTKWWTVYSSPVAISLMICTELVP